MNVKVWGSSKQTANYRPAPTDDVRCEHCKFMFPPMALGGCRYVRGVIRGSATCDYFASRHPAEESTGPPSAS
ncbi:MAG TPA: hypothetical protein VFK76_09040 [Gaiellaceae bacterium]|nr:hypothetical protein [Gaiellaceae bacterium]